MEVEVSGDENPTISSIWPPDPQMEVSRNIAAVSNEPEKVPSAVVNCRFPVRSSSVVSPPPPPKPVPVLSLITTSNEQKLLSKVMVKMDVVGIMGTPTGFSLMVFIPVLLKKPESEK